MFSWDPFIICIPFPLIAASRSFRPQVHSQALAWRQLSEHLRTQGWPPGNSCVSQRGCFYGQEMVRKGLFFLVASKITWIPIGITRKKHGQPIFGGCCLDVLMLIFRWFDGLFWVFFKMCFCFFFCDLMVTYAYLMVTWCVFFNGDLLVVSLVI